MSKTDFNWDKYFASASWNEIYERSPFFYGQRLPSIVLQDAGLVYLSSLDLDFSLSDIDGLERVIGDIKATLQRSVESKNYYKAAAANADLEIISNLLTEQGHLILDSI